MRIAWASPVLLPAQLAYLGHSASVRVGWIPELLRAVLQTPSAPNLAVLAIGDGREEVEFDADGVRYYVLPWRRGGAYIRRDVVRRASRIVETFGADLVHVHGAEGHLAELAVGGQVPVPVAVSIQGLRCRCAPYQYAGLKPWELIRWQFRAREMLQRTGPVFGKLSWNRWSRFERRVIGEGRYFIGRTTWDRANVLAINPKANYYYGGEIMRPDFYLPRPPDQRTKAPPVLLAGRATPIKGITVFLDALCILKRRGIRVQARVFGRLVAREGLSRILRDRMDLLGLGDDITFLGSLPPDAVAREMAEATVFVHPSFMDNSPNTVAEAQLVGTPVIATDCGGVSSMIRHEETGILVPPGDPELLAERLINLLADPGLRMKLAVQAQREARVRHDPQAIASQLLNTYSAICAEYKGKELA